MSQVPHQAARHLSTLQRKFLPIGQTGWRVMPLKFFHNWLEADHDSFTWSNPLLIMWFSICSLLSGWAWTILSESEVGAQPKISRRVS